jgi:hypothetical protein
MAKRAPSSQPRSRRARVPADENPTQAADTAIASSTETLDEVMAAETGPTEDEIRARAYQRYLERGGGHGMDFEDWLEAERELKNRNLKSEI